MKPHVIRQGDHVGFFTNNAERLVEFYRGKLGFTVLSEEILPSSVMRSIFGLSRPCRMIKLVATGGEGRGGVEPLRVEVFHPLGVRLSRRRNAIVGSNHCSFSVGDRPSFLRLLRARGVPLISVRRKDRTVFFLKDPDGNRIEIRD